MAIDLDHPGTKQPWILGELCSTTISENISPILLVANFHTHPLDEAVQGVPYPSRKDLQNAWYRKVPGMVISRVGISKYGDDDRTDRRNPQGYPPDREGRPPDILPYRVLPGWIPQRAPNQWEPGLSFEYMDSDDVFGGRDDTTRSEDEHDSDSETDESKSDSDSGSESDN